MVLVSDWGVVVQEAVHLDHKDRPQSVTRIWYDGELHLVVAQYEGGWEVHCKLDC